jgi:hypothetical protein
LHRASVQNPANDQLPGESRDGEHDHDN